VAVCGCCARERDFVVKDSHSMGAGEDPPLAHEPTEASPVQDLGIRSEAPPEQCPGTYLMSRSVSHYTEFTL